MSSRLMPPKVGEALEEHALALHDGLARQGPDVAQAQHRGAVGDHGHQVALGGEAVGRGGIFGDDQAGLGHAGSVGQGQVALRDAGLGGDDLDLSPAISFLVVLEGRAPQLLLGRAHGCVSFSGSGSRASGGFRRSSSPL